MSPSASRPQSAWSSPAHEDATLAAVIALPSAPGTFGTALIVLGLILGAVVAAVAWRRLRVLLAPTGGATSGVAAVLAAALASSVGLAPFIAWRIVQDVRYTTMIPRPTVERIAAFENNLSGDAFDRIASVLPRDATYYVKVADPTKQNFEFWARSVFLPRIAVADPQEAEWLVLQGIDPLTLGVRIASVKAIPTSYKDDPPVYVARVAR